MYRWYSLDCPQCEAFHCDGSRARSFQGSGSISNVRSERPSEVKLSSAAGLGALTTRIQPIKDIRRRR